MVEEHYARYGGVHFMSHRPPEEINAFVRQLPAEQRNSLFDVLKALEKAGYISLYNDGQWADGEGIVGGSDDC